MLEYVRTAHRGDLSQDPVLAARAHAQPLGRHAVEGHITGGRACAVAMDAYPWLGFCELAKLRMDLGLWLNQREAKRHARIVGQPAKGVVLVRPAQVCPDVE